MACMEALCLNELRQVIFCTCVDFHTKDHTLANECTAVEPLHTQAIHLEHIIIFLLNTRQGLSCYFQTEVRVSKEEWYGSCL